MLNICTIFEGLHYIFGMLNVMEYGPKNGMVHNIQHSTIFVKKFFQESELSQEGQHLGPFWDGGTTTLR